jgi:hypothetical protein
LVYTAVINGIIAVPILFAVMKNNLMHHQSKEEDKNLLQYHIPIIIHHLMAVVQL